MTAAKAEYRIAPGDVVEVAVTGLPEMRQRATVQIDGTVAIAPVGDIQVAGLSPQEFRRRVKSTMAAVAFRQRAADGQDGVVTVEPDEVSASVVEYRPIFVTGDVVKSGEQPYRVAMNVRQAIVIAGGLDTLRLKATNPLQIVDLRTEYKTLWGQYTVDEARIWRLNAELGSTEEFDRARFRKSPLGEAALSQVLDLERQNLRARQEDAHREEAFLKQAVEQLNASIAIVSKQQADEAQGTQADVQDLQTVLDLMSKGNVTSSRVNEARRAVLLASTRKLQTEAELLRLRRQQDDFSRQLTKVADQRRIALLQELESATSDLLATQVKLRAAEEKLGVAGMAKDQAVGEAESPRFTVFRKDNMAEVPIDAGPQTPVEPGDVIEVSLRGQLAAQPTN